MRRDITDPVLLMDLVDLLVSQWTYDQDYKVIFFWSFTHSTVHAGHCLQDCTFELCCKMSQSNKIQPVYTILFCPHIQSQVVKPLLISWLKIWSNTNMPNNKLHTVCCMKPWKQLHNRELRHWSACLLRWSLITRDNLYQGTSQTFSSHTQPYMYT